MAGCREKSRDLHRVDMRAGIPGMVGKERLRESLPDQEARKFPACPVCFGIKVGKEVWGRVLEGLICKGVELDPGGGTEHLKKL